MKVVFTKTFLNKLDRQVNFIARDKPIAAEKFRSDIILMIEKFQINLLLTRNPDFLKMKIFAN
ncbi:hypothetical protein HNQ03_000450 [Chryseobacterium sp. 16F]|uniref:ParE-like toxin of type II ParDE toxin-antitoxin system n=1 Tax=Frigoriflavimonas asaccharolytica TaxID=2735899 RepID=A0A8J8KAE0_9FLAO|nr:hypothetical protein [Frigoriflavimonas asaccharolytica]